MSAAEQTDDLALALQSMRALADRGDVTALHLVHAMTGHHIARALARQEAGTAAPPPPPEKAEAKAPPFDLSAKIPKRAPARST